MSFRTRVLFGLTTLTTLGWPMVPLAAGEQPTANAPLPPAARENVDFARDIEPILAKHCYDCHGPDSQEGQLRLDAKAAVFKGGVTGPVLVPGKSPDSLLVHRLAGLGGEDRMPLDEEPLTDAQIALVRAWIDQGAVWPDGVGAKVEAAAQHWAYVKPQRPGLPAVKDRAWVRNAVDAFILARLEKEGFEPSPEAAKERLLRRVTLDLTGIPPTLDEIDAFLDDTRPGAYERVVDRLLASPRYGERWAVPWLDAARYADSNGYQRDGRRTYWAYRDWVVRALNEDMPFDQFTIEQIAGDLLPNPSFEQVVATGFHRGTMANVEAGTDPEEEHVLAVIDRVNTTGAVWLGTTIECAQCHSHKYDPFSQKDFYQLYAFFNNTEKEIESSGSTREFVGPSMPLPLAPEQEANRDRIQKQLGELNQQVKQLTAALTSEQPAWERQVAESMLESNWHVLEPTEFASREGAELKKLDDNSLLAAGDFPATDIYEVEYQTELPRVAALRIEVLTDPLLPDGGPGRVKPGNFILSEFTVEVAASDTPSEFEPVKFSSALADYSQPKWPVAAAIDGNRNTGWAIGQQFGQGHHAVFVSEKPIGFEKGTILRVSLDQQYGNARTIGRFQLLAATGDPNNFGVPENIRKLVALPAEKRNKKQSQELADYYLAQSAELKDLQARQKQMQSALEELAPPTTLVMKELPEPRMTTVFVRGDFLKPGKPVEPGTPAALHPLPTDAPRNRLALARWLVDDENPLVARVTVNRHWAEFFGRGLVETLEDFGTQGEPPTHPELLDWLAVEFTQPTGGDTSDSPQAWSMKRLHRLIVTSAAYRQSARVTPDLLRRDPYNRLYTRGPRFRLKAEFVRDNALATAGLLSDKLYGPPVFPYQPAGVWNHIGRASNVWTTSSDEDLYRRGLYVYWRRTVPYPSFVNFDAPSREACSVQRSRSNTPLQALTLMNDPVYFEAATRLAARVLTEPDEAATIADRATFAFRLATSRQPTGGEIDILVRRYEEELVRYQEDPAAAKKLIAKWPTPPQVTPAEFAAWIHVSNILLNLDEAITK